MKISWRMTTSALLLGLFLGSVQALMAETSAPTTTTAPASVTGTWKWTSQGRNGSQENKLELKQDGEKLTGTYTPGFANATPVDIKEGTVKGEDVSFKITRSRNNQEIVILYTAKLAGDTLKGSSVVDGNANAKPRDFEAKRATDAATEPTTQK